ncbi:hypothetical protein BDZ85DRAFT_100700 [Elsinoe ampelina]|uniref:Uncharacterized protein n=1 Tax=Elsinoe ampelina TaxID=302913 RepID=A0A6A6GFQ0_9PEZI|nr:hypothetical protein BDZ85DRAFT_100700 [Elsinoe ampelina]
MGATVGGIVSQALALTHASRQAGLLLRSSHNILGRLEPNGLISDRLTAQMTSSVRTGSGPAFAIIKHHSAAEPQERLGGNAATFTTEKMGQSPSHSKEKVWGRPEYSTVSQCPFRYRQPTQSSRHGMSLPRTEYPSGRLCVGYQEQGWSPNGKAQWQTISFLEGSKIRPTPSTT